MKLAASIVRPGFLFLAPAMIVLGLFFFAPILAAMLLSLTDFDIYALADSSNARWVGWENYRRLLSEPLFWQVARKHALFRGRRRPAHGRRVAVGGTSGELEADTVSWAVAHDFFAPVVTTLVAVAVVWRYLYHTRYGTLNYALGWLGLGPIDWLGNSHWAMFAIILLAVWKNFGYNMVIFVAGLQSIPEEVYDAARIDGAAPWHTVLEHQAAALGADFLLRRRHDDDRLFPAFCGTVCDDARRSTAQHLQRRDVHVRRGLSLVERRLCIGDRLRAVRDHPGGDGCTSPLATGR